MRSPSLPDCRLLWLGELRPKMLRPLRLIVRLIPPLADALDAKCLSIFVESALVLLTFCCSVKQ